MSHPADLASALAQGFDILGLVNAQQGPYDRNLGIVYTKVTEDAIEAELTVRPDHHQPYGIVHGGVYASMVEALASVGAAIHAWSRNQSTVGLENTTSFLRAVRSGVLRARGVLLHGGRRTQVWEITIRDEEDRIAATGRVRMICLEQGAVVAGETIAIKET